MRKSVTIVIGGEAGQGLVTTGDLLCKVLATSGYHFMSFQGYHSRVRGGHNTFAIRVGDEVLFGPEEEIDILLALNTETETIDGKNVKPNGIFLGELAIGEAPSASKYQIPYKDLGSARNENFAALGVLIAMLKLPYKAAEAIIRAQYSVGIEDIMAACKSGFDWWQKQKPDVNFLAAPTHKEPRALINGNEAIALGAVAGGIKFCAFYPMSPSTTVALSMVAWSEEAGLTVQQAEDEIAAINMAIGASYTGAPSLVTTSGGGFSLMVEGVSFAAMTETPLLIIIVQRPGPATGLPTRTEQADLNLALYAGHGEFPRAILTPGSVEHCFHLSTRGAWLAEESQGPVFLLSDQFLSDSVMPILPADLEGTTTVVNPAATHKEHQKMMGKGSVYERYAITENGISPRLIPGVSEYLVRADSDEHTAEGFITEDLTCRVAMQTKRLKKEGWLADNVVPPTYYGEPQPSLLLVAWGSTLGAAAEAVEALSASGKKVGLLHFTQVYPLVPAEWLEIMQSAAKVIFVEGNATGQFAHLVCRETGFKPYAKVLRFDGLPITANYILNNLEK